MRFRSPLLSQSRFLSFPPGTEMVHFPGFARARLCIHRAVRGFCPRGFPHSEISGSMPACGSPKLIAACHVFLRLLLPRHPPCALSSLTTKFTQHTQNPSHCWNFSRTRRENFMGLVLPAHRAFRSSRALRPSRLLQALIKIYTPCNFAQSIQLSNIVLAVLIDYSTTAATRVCRYELQVSRSQSS